MPRQLSADAFRALFAQETAEVFLMCLTLEHPSFVTPIYVVHNNRPIERNGKTFLATFFQIAMPEETKDSVPQMQLSIDNVDRRVVDIVRAVSGNRIKMTMEIVMASSPETVEAGPFVMHLLDCTYDANTVTGTLGFEDDVLNTAFPADVYNPANSPGLFR